MAPIEDASALAPSIAKKYAGARDADVNDWISHVDEVSAQIKGIIDGTVTDFDAFDKKLALKERAKQIREEETAERRQRFLLYGVEGKGEGKNYKWWCKRCFVEFAIDLPEGRCARCRKGDLLMSQEARRAELMGKLEVYREEKNQHRWRKDKWLRWKKSQALLRRSRNINYKAWEYWEPDTDSDEEGEPIVPKDNPEFLAMEADLKERKRMGAEKAFTAERCKQRGNECMREGDFVGAIEHYEEGLEYKRDEKSLWTNKALAELKFFRWRDAVNSCNKVIEYSEIFEDGFERSGDACFKAFVRRAAALRGLHKWREALLDLEDALKLRPSDREARELYGKTKAACEEEERLSSPPEVGGSEAPEGPVRVEIEESEDEEDAEALSAVPAQQERSLARLAKQDFAQLLRGLRGDAGKRAQFCARGGEKAAAPQAASDWQTRKVRLAAAEEVPDPSGLDGALRDAERCCVLWRKSQGRAVPLREEVKVLGSFDDEDNAEGREAAAFLRSVTPRVLAVLQALASGSEHHGSLAAPAVKHVWPLLSCPAWRHAVLELLLEWSQQPIAAKAMAEFVSRNPEPHLLLLLEIITQETKENLLPPGLEERAQMASKRMENEENMEEALEEVFRGLSQRSPTEMALSALGNLCLAGQGLPSFREQLLPFQDELLDALGRQLKPLNWRLCGPAAGALCNVVRLGGGFAGAVEEKCLGPLAAVLKEEGAEGGAAALLRSFKADGAGAAGRGGAAPKLLAALVNLLTVRPGAVGRALELGLLGPVLRLFDPEAMAAGDEAAERAALLASRLLSAAPETLDVAEERELLRKLLRLLKQFDAGKREVQPLRTERMEHLDVAARMLTLVLTKTPRALDRATGARPRVVELVGEGQADDSQETPAVPFAELGAALLRLVLALEPEEHVPPSEEGSPASRVRGNLALLVAAICEAQGKDCPPPPLRNLDLSPIVASLVSCLRKERGKVQGNVGVCVTRLAQSERYRQQVRDLNGMESLHQICLPRVEAQREREAQQHRLETSVEARRAEVQKRRSMVEARR